MSDSEKLILAFQSLRPLFRQKKAAEKRAVPYFAA